MDRIAPPAFERFYREHFAVAWRGLRRLGVAVEDCEDATQEVFVAAHRRWYAFDGAVPRHAWLFGIVRRIAWRFHRTERRRARRHAALGGSDVPVATPDEMLARAEAGRMLDEFLAQLDRERREAFVLGELEELGRIELGGVLGINPNTAYSRLQSARRRFFAHFAALDDEACASMLARAERAETPTQQQREHAWIAIAPALCPAAPASLLGRMAAALRTAIAGVATKLAIAGAAIVVVATAVASAHSEQPRVRESSAPAPVTSALAPEVVPASPPAVVAAPARVEPGPAIASSRATRTRQHADRLAEELALLDAARTATVAGDLALARRRLAEHVQRFGELGELGELRQAIVRDLDALSISATASGDDEVTERR